MMKYRINPMTIVVSFSIIPAIVLLVLCILDVTNAVNADISNFILALALIDLAMLLIDSRMHRKFTEMYEEICDIDKYPKIWKSKVIYQNYPYASNLVANAKYVIDNDNDDYENLHTILGIDKAFEAYKSILLDKFICINRFRYSYTEYIEKQLIEYNVLPFYARTLALVLTTKDLFATRTVQLCYVNDQEIAEERLKVIKRRIDILNGNDTAAIAKVMKEMDEERQ